MREKNARGLFLRLIALLVGLVLLLAGQVNLVSAQTITLVDDTQYLTSRFGLDLEQKWTADAFAEALAVVSLYEGDLEVDEDFTLGEAIQVSVQAANYLELTLSYTPEKTEQRLHYYDLETSGDPQLDAFVVTGLDADLYDTETAAAALQGEVADGPRIASLLYNVAEANGLTRHYLGYADDSQIDARLNQLWDTFQLFEDEALNEIGRMAVEEQVITGFNLKYGAYDAHFDPSLTLQYGHSSILHAHQLLVLLNSENLRAKVALEPKISIYQYLIEWGEIGEPTSTYAVREVGDDFYLAYAVEYDLLLEFDSKEDMERFDDVIGNYAKKWEGNEEAIGLIADSWWQPLYTALRDDMPEETYYKVHDCILRNGDYRLHTFVLDETIEDTLAQLQELAGANEIETVDRYCNEAFHNYLTGSDFQ